MRLLGHRGLRRILSAHGGGRLFTEDVSISMSGDGVQQDEDLYRIDRHARGWTNERVEFEKVPSDVGRALMTSGTFGANERPADSIDRKKKLASRLLRRELGLGSTGRQRARSGLLKQVFRCFSCVIYTSRFNGANRISYHPRTPILLSTMINAATLANSRMMAISSSPAPRTSKFACTTRLIRILGSTTK